GRGCDRRDGWVGLSSGPERLRASLWLESEAFNESEMALFSECRPQCAQTVLDTADIVRDGDFSPTDSPTGKDTARRTTIVFGFQSIQSGFQAYLPRRSSQKILSRTFRVTRIPLWANGFPR